MNGGTPRERYPSDWGVIPLREISPAAYAVIQMYELI